MSLHGYIFARIVNVTSFLFFVERMTLFLQIPYTDTWATSNHAPLTTDISTAFVSLRSTCDRPPDEIDPVLETSVVDPWHLEYYSIRGQ